MNTAKDKKNPSRSEWFLIANRIGAAIYSGKPNKGFKFLTRMVNPLGRVRESQLESDHQGITSSGSRPHGLGTRSTKHETVAVSFARRVSTALDEAINDNRFENLVVMAEPHFLGLLNHEFSKNIKNRIRQEIPREWKEGTDKDLEEYLAKYEAKSTSSRSEVQ